MDVTELRGTEHRRERLDESWFHLFSLPTLIETLRADEPYERNGQNGLLLRKTDHLRVVLEVARRGVEIGQHNIAGQTLVQILEGAVRVDAEDERRIAHAHEMVGVPSHRPREMRAEEDSAFLWIISVDG